MSNKSIACFILTVLHILYVSIVYQIFPDLKSTALSLSRNHNPVTEDHAGTIFFLPNYSYCITLRDELVTGHLFWLSCNVSLSDISRCMFPSAHSYRKKIHNKSIVALTIIFII